MSLKNIGNGVDTLSDVIGKSKKSGITDIAKQIDKIDNLDIAQKADLVSNAVTMLSQNSKDAVKSVESIGESTIKSGSKLSDFGAALKGVGKSLVSFASVHPVITGITATIAAVALLSTAIEDVNEKRQKAANSYSDYQSTITEIESINGELETVELPETVNDIGTNAFYITSVNGSTSINTIKVFNPECQISAEDVHRVEYTIDVDITLFGYPESTIYTFAQEYGNEFKVLTEKDTLTFPVAFSPEEGVVLEEPPVEEPPLEEPPTEDFSPQQPSGNDTAIGANNNIVTGNTEQPSSLPAVGAVLNDAGSKARYTVTVAGATLTYKAPTNKKVKKVTIPATVTIDGITYKVTDIAPNAFKGCKKLKKITIGTGITTIGKKAFAGCKNIKNIIVKSKSLKKIGKNAFKGINKAAKIKVPKNKLKAYKKLFKKAKLAKSIKVTK